MTPAGRFRERLTLQRNAWPTLAVTLTRVGTTATATTKAAHQYVTGDYVDVAGAAVAAYNGRKRITVTGPMAFTFAVDGFATSPASASATFYRDGQGSARACWVTLATNVGAELLQISGAERLQLQAIRAQMALRFRVRRRADLAPADRAVWRPTWPPGAATRNLELHGVLPDGNGVETMVLDCGVTE